MAFNRYSGHKKSNTMTTEFQQLDFPFVCCHVLVMVSVGHSGLYHQITRSQLLLSIFIQKNHLKNVIRMMCMLTNLAVTQNRHTYFPRMPHEKKILSSVVTQ